MLASIRAFQGYSTVLLIFFITSGQSHAATVQSVVDVSDTEYIRSVTSDLCHDPESNYRGRLKIAENNGNVYPSLEECLSSGGKLSESMKSRLGQEDPIAKEEAVKTEEKVVKEEESNAKFAGINWGLGLAFTNLGVRAVKDVTIENGTIRVNNSAENRAIALVESHYFFGTEGSDWGHGPYMAIGLIAEDGIDPLSNYGLGYMFGFKNDDGTSWNIGFGAFVDTDVPRLRPGLTDGGATTETDPSKLLTSEDEAGWMIMFSSNF